MVTELTVRDPEDGTASWFLNSLVTTRIAGDDTDGAFAVLEHLLPPNYETPYHTHHNEVEISYVLDGEITLYTEQGPLTATAGQTLLAPQEQPHGFRVTSDKTARRLIFITPAGYEAFFHEVGSPAESHTLPEPSEPDQERLATIASEYDIELLGPLPVSDE